VPLTDILLAPPAAPARVYRFLTRTSPPSARGALASLHLGEVFGRIIGTHDRTSPALARRPGRDAARRAPARAGAHRRSGLSGLGRGTLASARDRRHARRLRGVRRLGAAPAGGGE